MKTSKILPLVITLMSILFCSCEITEPLYFLDSDFNERHTWGILYYKDELFAVNNSSELPEQFLTLTNDTITINKLYQGETVYYYEKGENNWPEYALVKYKYIHLQLEKIYAIINDEIITCK